jgi:hypothetical protein
MSDSTSVHTVACTTAYGGVSSAKCKHSGAPPRTGAARPAAARPGRGSVAQSARAAARRRGLFVVFRARPASVPSFICQQTAQ